MSQTPQEQECFVLGYGTWIETMPPEAKPWENQTVICTLPGLLLFRCSEGVMVLVRESIRFLWETTTPSKLDLKTSWKALVKPFGSAEWTGSLMMFTPGEEPGVIMGHESDHAL